MKRLMGPVLIGLISWLALATILIEVLLPSPCIGCEDDWGAGLVAVIIAITTWVFVAMGVVLYSMARATRQVSESP